MDELYLSYKGRNVFDLPAIGHQFDPQDKSNRVEYAYILSLRHSVGDCRNLITSPALQRRRTDLPHFKRKHSFYKYVMCEIDFM